MTFECYCRRTFRSLRGLQTHIGMRHGGVPVCAKGHLRQTRRQRKCRHPDCRPRIDPAVRLAGERRRRALRKDPRNLRHPCWWCHRRFATERGMQIHMGRVHEGQAA